MRWMLAGLNLIDRSQATEHMAMSLGLFFIYIVVVCSRFKCQVVYVFVRLFWFVLWLFFVRSHDNEK